MTTLTNNRDPRSIGPMFKKAALAVFLVTMDGCYPKTCAPNDTSCLPCPDPANTNPACPPFPSDTKQPDAGVTK